MLTYTLRRLLLAIPTLLLISLVIFLLVEVAGGHVDADVAGTIVACVVERSVIEGRRVFHIVVVVDLSCAGGSNCSAENEAFIGGSQGGGVVLLVAVAGCNVGAHVAAGTVQRAVGLGGVFGALDCVERAAPDGLVAARGLGLAGQLPHAD